MKVTSEINNYDDPQNTLVRIHSHWSDKKKVVIEFVGGEKRTVLAKELIAAVENAQNTSSY